MTVFLGTLWSSIKEVKAPYVFDGEHGNSLQAVQENWTSSRSEGEVSLLFLSCGGNLGYILELQWGCPFKLEFVQRFQDSCLVTRDTSGISLRLGRAIGMLLKVRLETQDPFPDATVIMGFLSIFMRSQT